MAISFKKFWAGITIKPKTSSTADTKGDLEVIDSTGKLGYHNGSTVSPVVTEAHSSTLTNKDLSDSTTAIVDVSDTTKKILFDAGGTTATTTTITGAQTANRVVSLPNATTTLVGTTDTATLTNKTIDSDLNVITNIVNADIKALAAIDATKIADGSVTSTEFQYINTLSSNAQTQITAGVTATALVQTNLTTHIADTTTHGTTGDIVGTSDTQILTNKTIDSDSNIITNIVNADIKALAAIDATKIADGSVTSTEFQYINTLSSNAQTQIDTKVTGPASAASDNTIPRWDSGTNSLQNTSATINDSGRLGIGVTDAAQAIDVRSTNGNSSSIRMTRISDDASPPNLSFYKSRTTSYPLTGDSILILNSGSRKEDTDAEAATISMLSVATENHSATALGKEVRLYTTANTTTTSTQRMTIKQDGVVNIANLTASLPVKTNASKDLVSAAIDLTGSEVTGVLPVAKGGTGSATLLDEIQGQYSNYPVTEPTLALDFANSRSLDSRITFTRASTATYVNSKGIIATAAINEPRFDHDPTSIESLGLLIEETRTNIFTRSEEMGNAVWVPNATLAAVTSNTAVAPDGATTADTFYELAANGAHTLSRTSNITVTANTVYCWSVFLKPNGRTTVDLLMRNAAFTDGFTLPSVTLTGDGSVGTPTITGSGVVSGSGIDAYPNGWYRAWISGTIDAVSTVMANFLYLRNVSTSYLGDGSSGVYVWGQQLEQGAFPTSYIPTVASAVARSADLASMTGTNFSSWYNSLEGTIVSDSSFSGILTAQIAVVISDNTSNNYISIQTNPSTATTSRANIVTGGVTQAALGFASSFVADVNNKLALSYKLNDFAFSVDGQTVNTDTSGTLPTVSRMYLFASQAGGTVYSGHLASLYFYPKALSDAETQSISKSSYLNTIRSEIVALNGAFPRFATLSDVKAANTAGGTFTSGSFGIRTLNTLSDPTGFVTLSSNQFTLQPGEYYFEGSAPAYGVDGHIAKLTNASLASDLIIGTSEFSDAVAATASQTRSIIQGYVTIDIPTVFDIQHRCTTTAATSGLGAAVNLGVSEKYTVLKITKVK